MVLKKIAEMKQQDEPLGRLEIMQVGGWVGGWVGQVWVGGRIGGFGAGRGGFGAGRCGWVYGWSGVGGRLVQLGGPSICLYPLALLHPVIHATM